MTTAPNPEIHQHQATIRWQRGQADFPTGKYSRDHTWNFDGGATIPASSAPAVVAPPYSSPARVDPEEAFVAALSSCHMLTFLHQAYRQGFAVDNYQDEAIGIMTKNEKGVPWVSSVTLHPRIKFYGSKTPTPAEAEHLHHLAHERCFLANSVKTEVTWSL
jgi:organic hydroperoxide reductase OsmC/OhrA